MFESRSEWDTRRHEAMAAHVALLHERDELDARIASSLANVIDAYRWPQQLPQPAGTDSFRPEHIAGQSFAEDLTGELAVANKSGIGTACNLVRDIIALTSRLPGCWDKITQGQAPLWQARRIAQETHHLPGASDNIDQTMAPALGALGPARLFQLLDATLRHLDPNDTRDETPKTARFVRTGPDDTDPATGWLSARLDRPDAIFLDAMIQHGANKLANDGTPGTMDELRAKALGLLANPAAATQYLGITSTRNMNPAPANDADAAQIMRQAEKLAPTFTPTTQVYVHLWATDMWDTHAIARLERVGPLLIDRVADITQGTKIRLTPAIHIGDNTINVDSYEIPARIRQQVLLRNPHDIFPYSSTESRHLDLDHTTPYQPGQPNQTRPDNLNPLSRKAHRLKTHAGWHLNQPTPGTYTWQTPAKQTIHVDNTGSHPIRPEP